MDLEGRDGIEEKRWSERGRKILRRRGGLREDIEEKRWIERGEMVLRRRGGVREGERY